MNVLKFPDKRLFESCSPVTVFGEELNILLESMWETMLLENGIGLAANQVGLTFRMFTMMGLDKEKLFIVNPVVIKRSIAPANLKEGCLSAPGEFLIRPDRASWVELEFQDESGKNHRRVFKSLHAVCVEHEIEHLNGQGFMQSKALSKIKRRELAKKWGID